MLLLTQTGHGPDTLIGCLPAIVTPAPRVNVVLNAATLAVNTISSVTAAVVLNTVLPTGVEGDVVQVENLTLHNVDVLNGAVVVKTIAPNTLATFENISGIFAVV
jgi:hypothetical protein